MCGKSGNREKFTLLAFGTLLSYDLFAVHVMCSSLYVTLFMNDGDIQYVNTSSPAANLSGNGGSFGVFVVRLVVSDRHPSSISLLVLVETGWQICSDRVGFLVTSGCFMAVVFGLLEICMAGKEE